MKLSTRTFFALVIIAVLFLAFIFSSPLFGQQPGPRHNPNDKVISYALKNAQQEGNFYFLPFPLQIQSNGYSMNPLRADGFTNYDGAFKRPKAQDAQLVLKLLVHFEETKKVEVISFQLIRDQKARGASSVFHGIFLKAKPIASKPK